LANLTFILRDGTQKTVQSQTGTLMEAARNAGIAGIIGECGGACACGTCHVYLCARGLDTLGPATGAEMNILEFEDNATGQSRLACQIDVATVPDGLAFTVAGDQ
jgi:2Fe-2S ferredoxin